MEFLKELWIFLRVRKKLWLTPIIIIMVIFGGLLILVQLPGERPVRYGRPMRRHSYHAPFDN